tara:strand:+ start:173 stop:793 length:621 start_codon:yes stop_codon:yes gene_type:complete
MDMLQKLFPQMVASSDFHLPRWHDCEKPWSILADGEYGILSQIKEICNDDSLVYIHPSASIGDFVRIEGPCFIGADAEIRHSAYLRKGSWICEGAVVGHCSEVKNSILLPDSKAPHFNYVGDSILGFGVNLGAGTKLSNVRNDRREVNIALENGERISSGLRKLGALVGDGSQLGCNVVTNPGSVISPSSMISPNKTVSGWFGITS